MPRGRRAAGFRARGVLIDLDGTLVDTVDDLAAAIDAMLVELGRPAVGAQIVRTYVGKGARILVHRALSGSLDGRVDGPTADRALALFERHYARENGRRAALYPEVAAVLRELRAKGLRLACVTNKPQAFAQELLVRIGLAASFDLTLGGDALALRKPDPAPLLHACALLGLQPDETVAIGDSLDDAQAAHAAGMPVIIVPYGYNEGRSALTIDADAHVSTLREAAQCIEPIAAEA